MESRNEEFNQCGACGEHRKMKYWDICYECDQDIIDVYQNAAYSSANSSVSDAWWGNNK